MCGPGSSSGSCLEGIPGKRFSLAVSDNTGYAENDRPDGSAGAALHYAVGKSFRMQVVVDMDRIVTYGTFHDGFPFYNMAFLLHYNRPGMAIQGKYLKT